MSKSLHICRVFWWPHVRVEVGRLQVEFWAVGRKVGPLWLPDGLHLWWGARGVHVGWSKPKIGRRVAFDRV